MKSVSLSDVLVVCCPPSSASINAVLPASRKDCLPNCGVRDKDKKVPYERASMICLDSDLFAADHRL